MGDFWFVFSIGTVTAIGILIAGIVGYRRRHRDLREYLEPPLRECGVQFVGAAIPRLFQTGPFPMIEHERGRPQSTILGIQGEYGEYRIVTFRDPGGITHSIWALVEFEVFGFRRVRWRAESTHGLPAKILAILEG